MRRLRILALMHDDLVPPEDVEGIDVTSVDWKTEFDVTVTLKEAGHEVHNLGVGDDLGVVRKAIDDLKPHVVFNLLEDFHDVAVFDQNVVSYLELLRIPYTGCNPRGLLLARDKGLSKKLLAYHRIPVPEFAVFQIGRAVRRPKRLQFPLIVKSLTAEASAGISQASVVTDDEKLRERVRFVHQTVGTDAIAERYIDGRELYVGVLGNQRLQMLPVWELHLTKMPEEAWHIATNRVKWNRDYQKKRGVKTAEAQGAARRHGGADSPAVQARLPHPGSERLRAHRHAPRRERPDLRPRGQSQPAARLRRGLRRVGGEGRDLLPGSAAAHHQPRHALAPRARGVRMKC